MLRALPALFVAAAMLAPATAQERDGGSIYREWSLAQKLRVVCTDQHFGRVEDLVAEIPSGRITGAVVTMTLERGTRTVLVPWAELSFEPRTNLLQLAACLEKEDKYAAFDAAAVKTSESKDERGEKVLTGHVLVSTLQRCSVQLSDGAKGSAQGLTVELSRGHVAFVDVAVGNERAGDSELHPVPWSALRVAEESAGDGSKARVLSLAKTKEVLAAAPNLIEIIVQNPLYRGRVYAYFGVPRPEFDRG